MFYFFFQGLIQHGLLFSLRALIYYGKVLSCHRGMYYVLYANQFFRTLNYSMHVILVLLNMIKFCRHHFSAVVPRKFLHSSTWALDIYHFGRPDFFNRICMEGLDSRRMNRFVPQPRFLFSGSLKVINSEKTH